MIRRPFLGLLWSAPSWQSSNALCLAGPMFAARVGTVWTGRLLPLVSAIPQLNLEGLDLLYKQQMPTLPCESIFQVIASGLDVENCRNIVYGSTVLNIHYVIYIIGLHVTLMRPD